MKKKNIIFFEEINFLNIFFVITLKLIFFQIYFRKLSVRFQKEKVIKILKFIGINWIRHEEKNLKKKNFHIYYNKTSEKYEFLINKISNSVIYKKISYLLNIKKEKQKFFNLIIGNFLFGDLLFGPVSNLILLKKKFFTEKFNIIYFPKTLENYFSIKVCNEKVFLIGFHLFLIEFIKIILNFLNSFSKKNLIKHSKSKILYVPHSGLKYKNVYKKNFIFKKNRFKFFSNSEILVLDSFLNDLEKRYYKLVNTNFTLYPDIKKINLKVYILLFNNLKKNNFLLNYILIKLANVILNYKTFLKNNQKLKCAFFFYDINADLNLVFSCNLLNIETISLQERAASFNWKYFMFYDHYFISGKDFINLTSKNKFFFKNKYTLGLVRSNLLKKKKNTDVEKVLVFDVPNIDFYNSNLWGNFSSIKKRLFLYNGIIKLALKNPNINFIIKPKLRESFNDHLILTIKKKINKKNLKNIIFCDNFHKVNTYSLVNDCDVVMGSYSSIMDELFSIGNKILIYDKNFSFFSHPLSDSLIHCKNFSQLNMQFKNLLNNKKLDMSLNRIRSNFFYFGVNTNYNYIIKKINKIIECK
jgi:hypothetical protein